MSDWTSVRLFAQSFPESSGRNFGGRPVHRRCCNEMTAQKGIGMELSYTQNLEDYHLSLAFPGRTTGTYIDIGGGHPIADNVSFWFYERGWRGIVVEPQPDLAALYGRLRPRDTVVQGLIGRESGETD